MFNFIKKSVKKKIVFAIFVSVFGALLFIILTGIVAGRRMIVEKTAQEYAGVASILAEATFTSVQDAIKTVLVQLENPSHEKIIKDNVDRFNLKDSLQREQILRNKDDEWNSAPDSDPVKNILSNESSKSLKRFTDIDERICEVLIADTNGALISASGKTNDFYQADELWWKKAYDDGKGAIYWGGIAFDGSHNRQVLEVAVPVKDSKKNVIGVCKVLMDYEKVFSDIGAFKVGKTGHACVVDSSGRFIFHEGIEPLSAKAFPDKTAEQIFSSKNNYKILEGSYTHTNKPEIIAFSPLASFGGAEWKVLISRHLEEVLLPFKPLVNKILLLVVILLALISYLVYYLTSFLVAPIRKLQKSAEMISNGNIDYPVEIETEDEIGQMAFSFKKMVGVLKEQQEQLQVFNRELESKVKAKTKELTESREAAIKLLEDLEVSRDELKQKNETLDELLNRSERSRKIMISMLEDNNDIRTELEAKIVELKETQNMLVQAEKLVSLGRLVSEMAHEVNNPLQAISGRAQLALMEDTEKDEMREHLKIIEDQCYRASDIIKRLLDFSRPSKGAMLKADIKKVVDDTVKLLEHQLSLADVVIEKKYCKEELMVKVDINQMQEVFFNIFKNSAEAMPEGGKIRIQIEKKNNNAVISLSDTGVGIPSDELEKIMDPFYTTKRTGTGLGLSVCYGLVKQHKGSLTYESTPGKGTTAILELPIFKGEQDH